MKKTHVTLADVQAVYSGPEALLWELLMGEQIHVGGLNSSLELARIANIREGMQGVDLCCCLGAGMRLLAKMHKVGMVGVDATAAVLEKAQKRAEGEGYASLLSFVQADVTAVPLPDNKFDFAWGEDAWCYVVDKDKLVAEAARLVKKGGVVAFTDWIEGPNGLAEQEAQRINTFMKFPYMESLAGYVELMESHGLEVVEAADLTPEFAEYCDLYIGMVSKQLTFDALKIIGFDFNMLSAIGAEMCFMRDCAKAGKMGRGRFVGIKR